MKEKAIVVYLDYNEQQRAWFTFLYHSWHLSGSSDLWDLVVFTPLPVDIIPPDCKYVHCEPLSHQPGPFYNHIFINSIHCLTIPGSAWLSDYRTLCRSDVDVFLTPNFRTFDPLHIHCGVGGYAGAEVVRDNIIRTASELDLDHHGMHNLGSTYIGPSGDVMAVAGLQMRASEYLLRNDFAHTEGIWPLWFGGVVTMYAGEIAMNHHCGLRITPTLNIDNFSDSDAQIGGDILTIHCWHTDKIFSKFQYLADKYIHTKPYSLSTEIIRDWCMYCATFRMDQLNQLTQ